MKEKKIIKIATVFTDKQADYIAEFAAKRNISRAEAVRIIVDMKRRQDAEKELINNR